MLSGGGIRKPVPPSQQPGQTVIELNGNGKGAADAMDMDHKPEPNPPPPNGTLPPNGVSPQASASVPPKRPAYYAFAPPEEMKPEDISLRREVIFLVQQLCAMGKNVQLQARLSLFRSLVDRGVLFAVQWAMGASETDELSKPMISAGGEILSALLDHDINGVRGHVLKQVVAIDKEREAGKQGADKAETIVQTACRIMARSNELAVQSQVGEALKAWLDLPPGGDPNLAVTAASEAHVSTLSLLYAVLEY